MVYVNLFRFSVFFSKEQGYLLARSSFIDVVAAVVLLFYKTLFSSTFREMTRKENCLKYWNEGL